MVVKGYCFASLKAKTTHMFHVMLKTGGEIVGGACTCIVGRGQACSHISFLSDCSFDPVQPTKSSAVTSTSLSSLHDFALFAAFLPSCYRLQVLRIFSF